MVQLNIWLHTSEAERLQKAKGDHPVSKSQLARAVLLVGLQAIQQKPEALQRQLTEQFRWKSQA